MATAAKATAPPGQALERVRPQERALVQAASELGIKCWEANGLLMIDLSGPELAERFNVLAPTTILMQADPNFTPAITALKLDPREGAGDVYAIETSGSGRNKKMKSGAPLKTALEKLGDAAGIEELPPKIERHTNGDLSVTGFIKVRRPDGSFKVLSGSREWIKEDEYEKVGESCPTTEWESDVPLSEEKKQAWIKKNWSRVKQFRLPMTESKAYLRAYRKALKLKSKYTPEELEKPFLVLSTTFTPDTSDPQVLAFLMASGQSATNLLYGPAANEEIDTIDGHAFEHGELPANVDPETGEVLEDTVEEAEPRGHGPRPTEDPVLPSGPHEGKPVSEAARLDPGYVKKYLVGSSSAKWGTAAEQWLAYWHGEGGDDDIAFA